MEPNYLADRNPFSLAKPPSWWLRGLAAFDPDLVLLPSRRSMVFVVARRRRLSRSIGAAVDRKLAIHDPENTLDSVLCDRYGLVYVTSLLCTAGWTSGNLAIFLGELTKRDTWAHGGPLDEAAQKKALFEGGTALADTLAAQDRAVRAQIDRQVHDDVYHTTGDGWRSKQAREGARILNAGRPSLLATPKPMPGSRLIGV